VHKIINKYYNETSEKRPICISKSPLLKLFSRFCSDRHRDKTPRAHVSVTSICVTFDLNSCFSKRPTTSDKSHRLTLYCSYEHSDKLEYKRMREIFLPIPPVLQLITIKKAKLFSSPNFYEFLS